MLNEFFEPAARRHGFEFVSMGTAQEYQEMLDLPGLFHPVEGIRILGRYVTKPMRAHYQAVVDRYEPGNTVVVASGAAFGARIAQDKHGIPLATIVLQPAMVRSAYRPPVVAGAPRIPSWLPRSAKRMLFGIVDILGDRLFHSATVNSFRAELDLPPVKRLVNEWWLSPQCILGLFPAWFAQPQPDWPAHLRLTGFPMHDERGAAPQLPDDVRRVFEADPAPVVFTPGTGVKNRRWFFEAAAEACVRLGRPGVFLTRYPQQIPENLPSLIRHFEYVPFSQILPRTAVIVHAGGIGTCAQAFAAGIPQLLVPLAYDQPDNADRIKEMGVGDWLKPKNFRGPAVAKMLEHLIASPEIRGRCQALTAKFQGIDPLGDTCRWIESLVDGSSDPPTPPPHGRGRPAGLPAG